MSVLASIIQMVGRPRGEIVLSPYTLRFSFSNPAYSPVMAGVGAGGTWNKVDGSSNVWDWTRENANWHSVFANAFTDATNAVAVIAAGDTSGVTSTAFMFSGCTSLTSISLFDTSNSQSMDNMFSGCTSLTSIPLFDTSGALDMTAMVRDCRKVERGAFALYQQVSTQPNVLYKKGMFTNCGIDTPTGLAELQQIPTSWGGLAS